MAANMQDVAQRMRDIKIKLDQVPLSKHRCRYTSTLLRCACFKPAILCNHSFGRVARGARSERPCAKTSQMYGTDPASCTMWRG
jgi:hypothetical protein